MSEELSSKSFQAKSFTAVYNEIIFETITQSLTNLCAELGF